MQKYSLAIIAGVGLRRSEFIIVDDRETSCCSDSDNRPQCLNPMAS